MVEIVPIPKGELQRIVQANRTVLEVAQDLIEIARRETDPGRSKDIELAVGRLLSSSTAVSGAVQSTVYVSGDKVA